MTYNREWKDYTWFLKWEHNFYGNVKDNDTDYSRYMQELSGGMY